MSSKRFPLETNNPTPEPTMPPPATTAESPPPDAPLLTAEQLQNIHEGITAALKTCYDPEIPINIYELGLIYGVDVSPVGAVSVRMTLTSPACPVAGTLPPEVQAKVKAVPGVTAARVDVVWEPPWDRSRMSDDARLMLGIDD
jgi:FeS assembly SUF system protein